MHVDVWNLHMSGFPPIVSALYLSLGLGEGLLLCLFVFGVQLFICSLIWCGFISAAVFVCFRLQEHLVVSLVHIQVHLLKLCCWSSRFTYNWVLIWSVRDMLESFVVQIHAGMWYKTLVPVVNFTSDGEPCSDLSLLKLPLRRMS